MTLSFLTWNGTLKFQREDRERGRRIREGYEKNVLSATAAIVFRFTRRRCYRALTLALAGPSCCLSAFWTHDRLLSANICRFSHHGFTMSGARYLKVEVDEQDIQSKDNAVTEMYVTVLDRFHTALRKVSVFTVIFSIWYILAWTIYVHLCLAFSTFVFTTLTVVHPIGSHHTGLCHSF